MPTTTTASSSHGDDVEVRFVSTSTRSSVAQRLRPRGARTEEEAEIVRMRDDELRREMAFAGRLRPRFEGILCDGGEGNRRRRALLEAEARRRGIGPAAAKVFCSCVIGLDWVVAAASFPHEIGVFDHPFVEQLVCISGLCLLVSPLTSVLIIISGWR